MMPYCIGTKNSKTLRYAHPPPLVAAAAAACLRCSCSRPHLKMYENIQEKNTEIELRLEGNGLAISASTQVRTATQGWLIGVVLGWLAAFVLGCSFSSVLSFMLVLPFVSAGVIGGLIYAQLGDTIRPLRREKEGDLGNKKEFLRQLQGRSDPGAMCPDSDVDSCPPSLIRRIAEAATGALMKTALEVTMSAATLVLGFGGGGAGPGSSWWAGLGAHKKTKEK